MIFQVSPLRFEFQVRDSVWFPPGEAANIFRGAFGQIFRRIACDPDCLDARSCLRAGQCAYARMFEPRSLIHDRGPSGFGDRPRPFVLRAASLDGQRFEPGQRFTLEVNVFDPELPALGYFHRSFARLCEEGLGPGRPRVDLIAADELGVVAVDLSPPVESVPRITVTFLTPTELKSGGEILREPVFDALFKRARDRVTGLIGLYQAAGRGVQRHEVRKDIEQRVDARSCAVSLESVPAPVAVDFRGMGQRARAVRMTRGRFTQHEHERRSGRTGQRHSLGGFTGEAEYEGDMAEFVPYLEAAWWTGVGRLTVWGNGMVRTVAHPAQVR